MIRVTGPRGTFTNSSIKDLVSGPNPELRWATPEFIKDNTITRVVVSLLCFIVHSSCAYSSSYTTVELILSSMVDHPYYDGFFEEVDIMMTRGLTQVCSRDRCLFVIPLIYGRCLVGVETRRHGHCLAQQPPSLRRYSGPNVEAAMIYLEPGKGYVVPYGQPS